MRVFVVLLVFSLNASILVSQEDKPFSYKDDRQLFERVIRVEEGILHMQKTLDMGFEQRDKRFEDMNKRFEDLKWYMKQSFYTLYWILGILTVVLTSIISGMFFMIRHNMKAIAENGKNIVEIRHSIGDLSKEVRAAIDKSPPLQSSSVNEVQGQDAMKVAKNHLHL